MNTYKIEKTQHFDKELRNYPVDWDKVNFLSLQNFMGTKPLYFPKVNAKLLYNYNSIFLRFEVTEKNIIAVAKNHFDAVYEDSCVEFFFSIEENNPKSYFNLEINCSGKVLFGFKNLKDNVSKKIAISDIDKLNINTTFLGKIIDKPITEETNWFAECEIPFSLIESYSDIALTYPPKKWSANFYKCADKSPTPHWLTWNKVDYSYPNFHLPQYFGKIEFA